MLRLFPTSLVLFGLIFIGCTPGGPKNDEDSKDGKIAQHSVKDTRDRKGGQKPTDLTPDFTLTAEEMTKEFIADEKVASDKFNNKIVQVTGDAGLVFDDHFHIDGVLTSKGGVIRANVECEFQPLHAQRVYRLSRGQKVKVVGKGKEQFGSFTLSDCSVTELEPSKIVKVTAEELAKTFDDGDKIEEKFGKDWIISGTVEAVARDTSFAEMYFVYLKGTKKTRLRMWIRFSTEENLPKKGQFGMAGT